MKLKDHNGIILIEALLAVVLLSTVLVVIIQAMMSSLRASHKAMSYFKATNLLDRVMLDQAVAGEKASPLSDETAFAAPYEGYRYSLQVSELEAGRFSDLPVQQLKSSVKWRSGSGETQLSAALVVPVEKNDESPK